MATLLKKIIIIGGGAGGLELATRLGNKLGRRKLADITLVDRSYNHLWKPLLHEVATGSIDEGVDALNYMAHASNHAFHFQLGSMIDIDRNNKQVVLDKINDNQGLPLVPVRRLNYDILVIALGSISNDFGIAGVNKYCIFLDNLQQAQRFHDKMLNLFLKFSFCTSVKKKINIVIVGGGATGVELSAELYNAVQQLHSYGFEKLSSQMLNITLVEAGRCVLPALPARISSAVHKQLTELGVFILTDTMVVNVDQNGLNTKNGKYIPAELIVWAAGVKVQDFMSNLAGLETNSINQLVVSSTLQTTRDQDIFAIGDCAACLMSSGRIVPPRAQAAHQMASCVYFNILAFLHGKKLKNYIYKDYGSLISLSRFSTIGNLIGSIMYNNNDGSSIMIEGCIARAFYVSLYRMHQVVLHGYIKTSLIVLVNNINRIIRPHLKLH